MGTKLVIVGRHEAKYDIEKDYDDVEQVNPTFKNEAAVARFLLNHARLGNSDPEVSVLFQATPPQVTSALVKMSDAIPVRVGLVFSKPGDRPPSRSSTLVVEDTDLRTVILQVLRCINPRASVSVDESSITVQVESPMRFEFERVEWID